MGLPLTFFDAIEGGRLFEADIASVYDSEKNGKFCKRRLSAPKIDCYSSHRPWWKRIGEGQSPGAVVPEADCDADDAFRNLRYLRPYRIGLYEARLKSRSSARGVDPVLH